MPEEKTRFSVALKSDTYQRLINDTLGDKVIAQQFVADITTVVSQNQLLKSCEPLSIVSAGLVAQSLKLPLSQTLGFAYVVPYSKKAQFQIGWKGLVQLAIRSGQYETLGVREVHEGEALGLDEFGDEIIKFDHKYDNAKVIGYFAYFKLTSGFKKTLYWTTEQCKVHGKKYSKTFDNGNWNTMFGEMAKKTVLKQLISKYGIQSVDIQKAMVYDQASVKEDGTAEYVDNPDVVEEKPKRKSTVKNVVEETDEVIDISDDITFSEDQEF